MFESYIIHCAFLNAQGLRDSAKRELLNQWQQMATNDRCTQFSEKVCVTITQNCKHLKMIF